MIVPLLTNTYGKISTVIVFDAPKISQGRSTGAEPFFWYQTRHWVEAYLDQYWIIQPWSICFLDIKVLTVQYLLPGNHLLVFSHNSFLIYFEGTYYTRFLFASWLSKSRWSVQTGSPAVDCRSINIMVDLQLWWTKMLPGAFWLIIDLIFVCSCRTKLHIRFVYLSLRACSIVELTTSYKTLLCYLEPTL